MKTKIILASASPRRKELLSQIGIEFTVIPSTKDEIITKTNPDEVVQELSYQKASDIALEIASSKHEECIVIGADTIVAYNNEILGKPKDAGDAERMLKLLQGNTHQVYTGVTLIKLKKDYTGITKQEITFSECTEVVFNSMTQDEIHQYVLSGEPMDKAGAYGIQGKCAAFIERIHGDYNNVVGLPVSKIYQQLKKFG